MLLLRVADALDAAKVPYALVGGYAVALHGVVRGTVDIDIVLGFRLKYFEGAEAAFRSIGLQPRLPVSAEEVFRFREEYVANRNLTAWTFVNPADPSEIVDVILTRDLAGMKTKRVLVKGRAIKIVALGDLIRMKHEAGRPQDHEDVRALSRLRTLT
jgi:hypothetical protein